MKTVKHWEMMVMLMVLAASLLIVGGIYESRLDTRLAEAGGAQVDTLYVLPDNSVIDSIQTAEIQELKIRLARLEAGR